MRNNRLVILFVITGLSLVHITCNPYVSQGEGLYKYYCSNCHMDDGSGLEGLIPPLTDQEFLEANRSVLPCILKHGTKEHLTINGTTYTDPMDGFKSLTETEILNILNYVGDSFGNKLPVYQPAEVKMAIQNCLD